MVGRGWSLCFVTLAQKLEKLEKLDGFLPVPWDVIRY